MTLGARAGIVRATSALTKPDCDEHLLKPLLGNLVRLNQFIPSGTTERSKHVLKSVDIRLLRSHSNLHPSECIRLKCLEDGCHASMPARASALAHLDASESQVQVIEDQNTLVGGSANGVKKSAQARSRGIDR
jgi:hypothetical protein